MPVLTPTGIQFLIEDLESEVLLRTENRTTDTSRADVWLRDALLEIAGNPDYRDDFPELEIWGPVVNLSINVQEYEESMFINVGDTNELCADILIWIDYPANTIRRRLDTGHYQKTDRFQPVYSLPTEWYRYSGFIGFNPVPDLTYQVQSRTVRMHPINDIELSQTVILLPRDWNEILIWAAVQRGFAELMEYEKSDKIHTLLYGDPNNKAQPGLVFHVKRKRRKEAWRMESRLSMTRRPYMFGLR
jgi:hypothetical protein